MNSLLSRWLPAVLPAAAVVSIASHAASTTPLPTTGMKAYAFVDIESIWQRATHGQAVAPDRIAFLSSQVTVADATAAQPPQGVIELDEDPPPPSSPGGGSSMPKKLLPVASLPCTDDAPDRCAAASADLHSRTALLEQLLTALATYRDPASNPARSEDVVALGNAAHLELFVAHSLLYLEGETREQKCASYSRAVEHARYLGWSDPTHAPSDIPVRSGWQTALSGARDFYVQAFTKQIPSNLCELHAVTTKAETESAIRGHIDTRIQARVEGEIDATTHSLAAKQTEYATALSRSAITVPTGAIFALRRAVEDSASLETFVTNDTLMLSSAPNNQKAYLTRIREKAAELDQIKAKANPAELEALMTEARTRLTQYGQILGTLVGTLRAIADLPGLDATTRSSLGVCKTIPDGITADNFMTFANTFDTCVTQTAAAYSALKDRSGSNPTYTPLLEKVTSLSRVYIANMNKPPHN